MVASFLIENWYFLVLILAVVVIAIIAIIKFFRQPSAEQMRKVKEWLLLAVIEAEKIFGGKTGEIKLRYVYDLFIMRFPAIAKVISFETFSFLVDEALDRFKKILETNTAVQEYVEEGEYTIK